jgi:NAD-dependent deacetylase
MTTRIPDKLIKLLNSARRVTVLTGAGISAESGVPTFRDAQTGLWARYQPEDLATPHAFRNNPKLVWKWYAWRRELVASVEPNPGHDALVALEQRIPQFTLITQNVDGLHQRAGSQNVIELHGNIQRTICFDEGLPVTEWLDTGDIPPRCPRCNGLLRPDVVWFGESLPQAALHTAFTQAEQCDLFFSIGTSTAIQPAASLPFAALDKNIPVVEINPNSTTLTPHAAFALPGPSGKILPAILELLHQND